VEASNRETTKTFSIIFSLLACLAAEAGPITITEQATASGFLASFGDTANVFTLSPASLP
jgi:hypothetical protein